MFSVCRVVIYYSMSGMDEIILDAEVSDLSISSDEEEKAGKIRSVVHKVRSESDLKYILVSDETIGSKCQAEEIIFISKPRAVFRDLAGLGLKYLDTLPINVIPMVMVQGGNEDIDPGQLSANNSLSKENLVKKLEKEIKSLADVVQERGGLLAVTSLIPCPKTQVYVKEKRALTKEEVGEEQKKENRAKAMQKLLLEMNNKIIEINKLNGAYTPNLKSVVEVTGRAAKRGQKKGKKNIPEHKMKRVEKKPKELEQKRIKTTLYQPDMRTPKPECQQKMMSMAINSLKHMKSNRWKMGYPTRSTQ